jgi:hypothetical protein
MQWRLASTPVANVDHATGDIEGTLVSSGRKTPCSASFWKLGRRPSRMSFVVMPGSIPSKPRITTFLAIAAL